MILLSLWSQCISLTKAVYSRITFLAYNWIGPKGNFQMSLHDTSYRLNGEDYGYVTSRITDRDGAACFTFKHTSAVTLEAVCAMERATVLSTFDPAVCDNADVDIPAVHVAPEFANNTCKEVTLVLPAIAGEWTLHTCVYNTP